MSGVAQNSSKASVCHAGKRNVSCTQSQGSFIIIYVASLSNLLNVFASLRAFRIPPEVNRAKCYFTAMIQFVLPLFSLVQCLA